VFVYWVTNTNWVVHSIAIKQLRADTHVEENA